jgi:hypothetical protein
MAEKIRHLDVMRATCTELYTHIDWNCRLIKTWANAHIEEQVMYKIVLVKVLKAYNCAGFDDSSLNCSS